MTTLQLHDAEIADTLDLYGVTASPDLREKIRTYIALLLKWNRKISLTTVTNPSEILRFHFGESLFAISIAKIENGRLADVGSGAGFPGLTIRLFVESLEVELIESNAKKAAFLSEVARELCLKGVSVICERMTEFDPGGAPFDFITARALGQHQELLTWSQSHLVHAGKLVLWLGDEDKDEISQNIAWNWDNPVKIPNSRRRFLLFGSPRAIAE